MRPRSGRFVRQMQRRMVDLPLPLRPVTEQPLFYLAILAVILGVQLFLAGFLGELINRGSSDRNKYLIDKTLD